MTQYSIRFRSWTGMLAIVFVGSNFLISSAAPPPQSKPESPLERVPKVVAIVNGQNIVRDQLARECLSRYGTIVLDNLLNKHLILQACKAQGISITEGDVRNEIHRVSNKFGLTAQSFLDTIEKERQITPSQYATEIVFPMLALRALAADKIQVSKEEVDRMLQSEYGPKVQARMIAVSDSNKANQLHAQVAAAPEQFKRIAKEQSEDAATASVEGLLPPIRQFSGDDQLERIAFQLQPNTISPVFQIGEMYIILQCVRHLEPTPPPPQMLPAIQERITDELRDRRLGKAADEIFKKLQETSQIVRVYGNPELEQRYPSVAGVINQQPVGLEHLAAECIARHGRQILKGEINRLLLEGALKKHNKQVTQQDLDAEIARAADSLGYIHSDGRPNVDAWVKSVLEEEGVTIEQYVRDAVWPSVALKKIVESRVQVTEEDLQKGFESNFGARAEVLAIVLSNQRVAEDVWKEARANQTEAYFGELAAKYSVEPVSRSNYGKVPPIRKHSGQPTLESQAFATAPGTISGLIAVGDQYVILFKQGMSTPVVQDLQAVRGELIREISEKKIRIEMQNELDVLMRESRIENFMQEKPTQAVEVKSATAATPSNRTAAAPSGQPVR